MRRKRAVCRAGAASASNANYRGSIPTPPRIQFEGAIQHVWTRGNGRGAVCLDDVDYNLFLHELEVSVARSNWRCHRFCLMPNHYHLLIETPQENLSNGMQRLNSVYARRFNQRHKRLDHVFRARFRSKLIHRDEYMMEVARYIDLNPVEGGLCVRPEDWPWSSFAATVGLAPVPQFLTLDRVLGYFGGDDRVARARYAAFVRSKNAPRSIADLEARLVATTAPPATALA